MTAQTEINTILHDPTASFWLKDALRSAIKRDPVDASHDAALVARLLERIANEALYASK